MFYDLLDGGGCKLKVNALCSPTVDPCCTSECKLVPREEKRICDSPEECKQETVCDGRSPSCPQPVSVPDMTPCDYGTKVKAIPVQSLY